MDYDFPLIYGNVIIPIDELHHFSDSSRLLQVSLSPMDQMSALSSFQLQATVAAYLMDQQQTGPLMGLGKTGSRKIGMVFSL